MSFRRQYYPLVSLSIVLASIPGQSLYAIASISPWIVEAMALSAFLTILVLRVLHPCEAFLVRAGTLLVLLLVCLLGIWASPMFALLAVPFPILVGLVSVSSRYRELLSNYPLHSILTTVSLLAVSILVIPYVAGLLLATPSVVFGGELVAPRDHYLFISTFFAGRDALAGDPLDFNAYFYLLSALSSIYACVFVRGDKRILAISLTIFLTLLNILGIYTVSVDVYSGVSPLYFEWGAWPAMFVVIVLAFHHILSAISSVVAVPFFQDRTASPTAGAQREDVGGQSRRGSSLVVSSFLVSFAAASLAAPLLFESRLQVSLAHAVGEAAEPAVVTDLRSRIGIREHSSFSGRVLNITGAHRRTEDGILTWRLVSSGDSNYTQTWDNDLRTFGLWSEGVPTLIQYNQAMSPLYYYFTTRAFAVPEDIRIRSLLMFSTYEHEWLLRWGVRLILADSELQQPWLREVGVYPLDREPNHPLRLYEVEGWRPHWAWETERGAAMAEASMLTADASPPAHGVDVAFTADAISITVQSEGVHTVIVPAVFSNCFEAISTPTRGRVTLFPAYNSVLGIELDGSGHYVIDYRYGPLHNPYCLIDDWRFASSILGPEAEWLATPLHHAVP